MGRCVFSHRGNGLIVDNVMKPMSNLRRELKKKQRPSSGGVGPKKQELERQKVGLSRRLSDKAVGKSGDLIRKRVSQAMKKSKPQKKQTLKMQEMK